jgi:hypothetical protein
MFFKKKEKIEHQHFDVDAWREFVRFLAIQKFAKTGDKKREFSSDKVFVNFKYLDVSYNHLLYKIKRENGNPIGISFWLPDVEENKWMDCKLINRCATTKDAINYITTLYLEN